MAVSPIFNSALKDLALIKGGGVRLVAFNASHIDAVDTFIQLFDTAATADVTLGGTVPDVVLSIPAGDATLRGHIYEPIGGPNGVNFQNGLVAAVTTTADGNTAVTTAIDVTFYTG
jgi:hypothetical protein